MKNIKENVINFVLNPIVLYLFMGILNVVFVRLLLIPEPMAIWEYIIFIAIWPFFVIVEIIALLQNICALTFLCIKI